MKAMSKLTTVTVHMAMKRGLSPDAPISAVYSGQMGFLFWVVEEDGTNLPDM
jgi:hypothetical protein